jgi:hypothetical protein
LDRAAGFEAGIGKKLAASLAGSEDAVMMTSAALLACLLLQDPVRPPPRPGPPPLTIPKVDKDGLVCFCLYTVQNRVLKLTAQFYPLEKDDPRAVRLEVREGEAWKEIARTEVVERGWTAHFRVENWDSTKDADYRVAHGTTCFYTGRIRRDPTDKETIVVAAFTGNSNADRGPRPDMIRNVKAHDADLLFFSGDQVYDHGKHYASWLVFGRQFGEITRDRPTITVPDDHDVGQGNIWGAGGKKSKVPGGTDGGYFLDAEFVKEVERAQTWHLPDPYDPTPIEQGIGVYYTSLTVGGIGFAIIEDRKWKSGPEGLIPKMGPRPDHINDPNYDPKTVDVPGAVLLGDRQHKFLDAWMQDWRGQEMKAVLSQTVFANAAHIHGSLGGRLLADLDSNGWPQSGRNRALASIRKGFAAMIGGDQHLATVIQHGIDDWNDAGWSFCVPSIVNYYNRWWWPLLPGKNPKPGAPLEMTGEHLDGFGNKLTMHAYANPNPTNFRAAGHGIVRFDRKTRWIAMECWPRHSDVTAPDAKQFPGWPVTIHQEENYGKKAVAYLPTLEISGQKDPVVQVIEEASGEILYTIRIQGASWRPKVFKPGLYTVKVGEGDRVKTLTGVRSLPADQKAVLEVKF